MANANDAGVDALNRLKSTEPPSWLVPNPSLSETTRAASQYLFSSLRPFSQKSPLDKLLVDGFDAEQIWQQIDLQSQPLVSTLRRRLKHMAKNPEEICQLKVPSEVVVDTSEGNNRDEWNEESDAFDEELDEFDEDEDKEGVEKEEKGGSEEEEDDGSEDEGEGEEGKENEEEKGEGGGIDDKFFKLNEFLEIDEDKFENGKKGDDEDKDSESDGFDEELDEFDEDEDESDDDGDEEDEEGDGKGNARYEDFFRGNEENGSKRKAQPLQKSDESEDSGDEDDREIEESEDSGDEDDMEIDKQKKEPTSTHEKQLKKFQSKIEEMEKANIEPKTWTMQGEITAAKRPKNSALGVDLDFDHNVRPAPVITEEVTALIEDIIQNRIIEGNFNDVQRAPKLPSKAPREVKELDDNKSKQGLAEIYEQEYVQKIDPTSAPLSFKDELKNEASMLFKRLCLKLDALSHFNFAPKPVIEDMTFQANVPALAMEEIAPVAVSDATMLAPEEVFDGKGDVKEEAELTQEERKRRRANKKRKFKAQAVKKSEKKAPVKALSSDVNG